LPACGEGGGNIFPSHGRLDRSRALFAGSLDRGIRLALAECEHVQMIEALFNQPSYLGAKKLLDATVLRHTALATNLANLETPHYQRVDVAPSFQADLKRAIAGGGAAQIASLQPRLAVDAEAVASSRDGNTVHLENELVQMSQNTVQHTLETQVVSSVLLRLRVAITGRSA